MRDGDETALQNGHNYLSYRTYPPLGPSLHHCLVFLLSFAASIYIFHSFLYVDGHVYLARSSCDVSFGLGLFYIGIGLYLCLYCICSDLLLLLFMTY